MRMVIVDDHDIFRQSLTMLLSQKAGHEVVAHYESITQLLAQGDYTDADLQCILLDYHMPGEAPLAALNAITRRWPSSLIVFLTGTRSVAILRRIIASPVHGVFHKQDGAAYIMNMLDQLHSGGCVISSHIAQQLESVEYGFTEKEFDVLFLLTQGRTPSQIADDLCVSKRTIEKHKENMMRKADFTCAAQLIELGHRLSLVE